VTLALLNEDFDPQGVPELIIEDLETGYPLLHIFGETGTWTVEVTTGQVLDLTFGYGVQTTDQTEAALDMAFDLGLSARARLPEPATMLLLAIGVIPVIGRYRRRKK